MREGLVQGGSGVKKSLARWAFGCGVKERLTQGSSGVKKGLVRGGSGVKKWLVQEVRV